MPSSDSCADRNARPQAPHLSSLAVQGQMAQKALSEQPPGPAASPTPAGLNTPNCAAQAPQKLPDRDRGRRSVRITESAETARTQRIQRLIVGSEPRLSQYSHDGCPCPDDPRIRPPRGGLTTPCR